MHLPRVVVEPPDSRGLRQVRLGAEVVDSAWSLDDLRKILVREGFPEDVDLEDRALITWRGVGSDTWPDRRRGRLVTAWAMVAGLVASTAFLNIVGGADALTALTFASRVTGVILILAGDIQLVSALAVWDYWGKRRTAYSGLFVMIGVFISLFIHVTLVVLWFEEREFTPWVFGYMPLAAWALWALWIVVRQKVYRGVPHPRKVAAGVVATALIAGANFAYSAAYQPYAAHVQIAFTATFGKPQLDPKEPVVYVPVRFSLQNTGKVPFTVLGSAFWVHARTSEFDAGATELSGAREDVEWHEDSELHAGSPEWTVLSTGLVVDPGDWFDPGTGQVEDVVVQVPKGADYESLEADGEITTLRKDRGRVGAEFAVPHYSWAEGEKEVAECPEECPDHVFYIGELTSNNNVTNVTRKQRYAIAVRLLGEDSSMYAGISPLNAQGKVSDRNLDPDEPYGVATVLTGTAVVPFATVLKTAT